MIVNLSEAGASGKALGAFLLSWSCSKLVQVLGKEERRARDNSYQEQPGERSRS